MKVFALTLCLVISALAAAGDQTASTDAVTAEFLGSSGGLRLSSGEAYVMVQQEKLQEVASSSCPQCTSINVAGQNSWTELAESKSQDGSVSVYTTTFSVEEKGVSFELTAHLARTQSTVEEVTPCSGCASDTAGVCKNDQDMTCNEFVAGSNCSDTSTACTETVTVYEDQLKFSFVVSGFTFSSPDNKFVYGIVLKNKDDNPRLDLTDSKLTSVTLSDASISLPTTGVLKGGAEDTEVAAKISMEIKGSQNIINFEFDSWEEGLSLYYDPTMEISPAAHSSRSSPLVSTALSLLAIVAILLNV